MTLERVVKWLGFLCLLAGIIRMGMTPSSLIWGDDSTPEVICGFMACMLMAISSIALYMSQSRETGVLGFIAALLLMIGNGRSFGHGDAAGDNYSCGSNLPRKSVSALDGYPGGHYAGLIRTSMARQVVCLLLGSIVCRNGLSNLYREI
ncbi:hypothetical protein [Paenibacillus sp. Soil724D2]|uniref:hypothetical protein n=1 Tax=Paenibacillus sp. (strain Soil724D2) TaxID=1736392 RepID=UPI0012E35183|nr:hypothetical protein [Paenibacillus sp. Soil724D2]